MKRLLVMFLIICSLFSLTACKSNQEKFEGYFQNGIEELNNEDFHKSAKYFGKAKKVYYNQDFDELLVKELKGWWNNYIESDDFKCTLLEDEPRNKINDIRIAFLKLLDGENEVYDIFISNVHYHKGMKLIENDRKENIMEAIDEFASVMEVDESNYSSAQQELTYLDQERNRMVVGFANDMQMAIIEKDYSLAEECLSKAKKYSYEEETATVKSMEQQLTTAKKEKDLYTLEEFVNAYNDLPNVVPDLFGSMSGTTFIDKNNYCEKSYSEETNYTLYQYYADSIMKQPLLGMSVNENNKVVSVYIACTSSDYTDDSLMLNPIYRVIYLIEKAKTPEQVNKVMTSMFQNTPNTVKHTWTYQHLTNAGNMQGTYVENFAMYSDLYLEENPISN